MFEFIIGTSGTGKTKRCLDDICAALQKDPLGPPLILLLPEHMTFKLEQQLAAMTKEQGGFSRAFVFGFRRLCHNILSQSCSDEKTRLSEIGKVLLLSHTVAESKSELTALAHIARQHHFTASLAELVDELKTYGVSAEDLKEAAQDVSEAQFGQKLHDIALLYERFQKEMQPRFNDGAEMLPLATQKIAASSWLEGAEIWLDGFSFFNPQEILLITALLKKTKNAHITLCLDEPESAQNDLETSLFYRPSKTYREMKSLCQKLSLTTKTTILKETHRFLSLALQTVKDNLFHFRSLEKKQVPTGLAITEAANARLEVHAVATKILQLCHEAGFHYRDIGVIYRSESYEPLLRDTFGKFKLPFFSDQKRLFIHHPLAELICSSLEAVQGWQYEPLMRCLKTDFFPLTRDEVDLIENYVLQFGIKGKKRWLANWEFSSKKYQTEEKKQKQLALINEIKKRALTPLEIFSNELANASDVRDYTTALYNFLCLLEVPQKLSLWQEEATSQGRLADASEHRQIWQDTITLMDQLVESCGALLLDTKKYAVILSDGLDALKIAMIPPGLDYVSISKLDQNSLENKQIIFILGANDGIMPRKGMLNSLLNEADRLVLSDLGIKLSHSSSEDSFAENFLLYRAFTLARRFLFISYTLSDSENKSLGRSCLIDRLLNIFSFDEKSFFSLLLDQRDENDALSRLATPDFAIAQLISALRLYRESGEIYPFWQDVYNFLLTDDSLKTRLKGALDGLFASAPPPKLSRAIARQLYAPKGVLSGSVTRFESFNSCPFSHFSRYALRLEERPEFAFTPLDLGNFLHDTLYNFGQALLDKKLDWASLHDAQSDAFCDEALKAVIDNLPSDILLSSGQYRHLLRRLSQTAHKTIDRLRQFATNSQFKTIAVEKTFGRGDLRPVRHQLNDNLVLNVNGKIDRIDSDGKHLLIIDYKSSEKSNISVTQVYYGLKLQLLTYMLAALNSAGLLNLKDPLPAGILYCFLFHRAPLSFKQKATSSTIEAALKKELRMPGWLLDDQEVIKNIDASLSFIKPSFTKQGTLSKTSFESVKTSDEFEALIKYCSYMLQKTGQDIMSGNIAVRPYKADKKSACAFCPYHAVCRFEEGIEGYSPLNICLEGNSSTQKEFLQKIFSIIAQLNNTDKNE